jgi:hypothetical protein
MVMEGEEEISWNDELENLIAQEGEKCSGLAWLYTESERYYSKANTFVALPVIILSTLTGFISGSSSMIFGDSGVDSIGIGGVSLFTGVLSTVGSYFAWAKKTEACRISAIQYNKLQKFIAIEMTLPKKERIRAKDMLKMIRDSVERLLETSPAVPPHIIEQYKVRFNDKVDIAHPEMVYGVRKLTINRNHTDTEEETKVVQFKDEKTSSVKIGVTI